MRALPALLTVLVSSLAALLPARAEDAVERGRYLAEIMDCTGCHTPGALAGTPDIDRYLAGSDIGFMMPGLGTFYPPNLTSDIATGLGAWTDDEIVRSIRTGERPDGRVLAPIMPWPSYNALTDDDAHALVAYLRTLEPDDHAVPGPFGPEESPSAPYLAPVMP